MWTLYRIVYTKFIADKIRAGHSVSSNYWGGGVYGPMCSCYQANIFGMQKQYVVFLNPGMLPHSLYFCVHTYIKLIL